MASKEHKLVPVEGGMYRLVAGSTISELEVKKGDEGGLIGYGAEVSAQSWVGQGCTVHAWATVRDRSLLRGSVVVSSGSLVERSRLYGDILLGANVTVQQSEIRGSLKVRGRSEIKRSALHVIGEGMIQNSILDDVVLRDGKSRAPKCNTGLSRF